MKKIKWGIIGPGRIAKRFADGLKESKNAELIAIASKNSRRRKKFGDKYKISKLLRFNNYLNLIKNTEIDAVYIALPNSLHKKWTIVSAQNGKHILCEKPSAIDYDQGKEIIDVIKKNNIFYMEGFMYRFHPQVKKIIYLISNNKIGKINFVYASFGYKTQKKDPDSRIFSKKLGGGSILDVGVYPISFCRLVAGLCDKKNFLNPMSIKGSCKKSFTGVEEEAYATLRFKNNIIARVACAITKKMDNNVFIEGTKGSILIEEPWTPGKNGGKHSTKIIVKNSEGKKKIYKTKSIKHLFSFEAEHASRLIQQNKKFSDFPGLNWNDTLGNLKTLDRWKKYLN